MSKINKNNRPDQSGVWEWFDENGVKQLVEVFDVASSFCKKQWLRVYFRGGYYNVNDEDQFCKTEWPDRWGKFIGPIGSIAEELLYLFPDK